LTPPPHRAGATLSIDLDALSDNYHRLAARAGSAETGASVKANAYGTGLVEAAATLDRAGCRTFFVAYPEEGEAVRLVVPKAAVYVLGGLLAGEAPFYERHGLKPVLAQPDEIEEWSAHCRKRGSRLEAGIHVETGINRLGLARKEIDWLSARPDTLSSMTADLVVGHLACADEPEATMNAEQHRRFEDLRRRLPAMRASLANSPGLFLSDVFRFDLVRPGIGLYGGNPFLSGDNPFKTVVRLHGRVLQAKAIERGDAVGYGSTWRASRPTRIAVIGAGYGDGYPRSMGSREGSDGGRVYIAGRFAPIVGRVSMDMITVDVTDVPEGLLSRASTAELIGEHVTAEEVAGRAGTISYEILTRLGSRYARVYSGGDSQ
jgi:alanine racemase